MTQTLSSSALVGLVGGLLMVGTQVVSNNKGLLVFLGYGALISAVAWLLRNVGVFASRFKISFVAVFVASFVLLAYAAYDAGFRLWVAGRGLLIVIAISIALSAVLAALAALRLKHRTSTSAS